MRPLVDKTHLVPGDIIARSNAAVARCVWGGFALCAVGAAVIDLHRWLS